MEQQQDPRIAQIMAVTKTYENFPKQGVNFVDVFPIVANPYTCNLVIQMFAEQLSKVSYSKIFMLEARGFIFGVPLTLKTGKPCFPVRKKGKLPGQCVSGGYGKQYGKDEIQIQKNCIQQGDQVVIVDDLLATGGTVKCAIDLLKSIGAKISKILVIVQLQGLNGRQNLGQDADKLNSIYKVKGKNQKQV